MENIIRAHNLGVPINYVMLKKEDQESICTNVLVEALAKMTVNAPMEVKIKTIDKILERSLKFAEENEAFEDCALFRDMRIILHKLPKYAKDSTPTTKKTAPDPK